MPLEHSLIFLHVKLVRRKLGLKGKPFAARDDAVKQHHSLLRGFAAPGLGQEETSHPRKEVRIHVSCRCHPLVLLRRWRRCLSRSPPFRLQLSFNLPFRFSSRCTLRLQLKGAPLRYGSAVAVSFNVNHLTVVISTFSGDLLAKTQTQITAYTLP